MDPEEAQRRVLTIRRAFEQRESNPGIQLNRCIVACAGDKRNPMGWEMFLELYASAVLTLDPDSFLRRCIIAYMTTGSIYSHSVVVRVGDYTGNAPHSETRESKHPGFNRPLRTYTGAEIEYKWMVQCMITTFTQVLEEIIRVHDFANIAKIKLRGGDCSLIRQNINYSRFEAAHQSKHKREYLLPADYTNEDAANIMHAMITAALGSRDGKVNIPKDCPAYTNCYFANACVLQITKRKVNTGYSVANMNRLRETPTPSIGSASSISSSSASSISSSASSISSSASSVNSSSTLSRSSSSSSISSSASSCNSHCQSVVAARGEGTTINIKVSGGNATINIEYK